MESRESHLHLQDVISVNAVSVGINYTISFIIQKYGFTSTSVPPNIIAYVFSNTTSVTSAAHNPLFHNICYLCIPDLNTAFTSTMVMLNNSLMTGAFDVKLKSLGTISLVKRNLLSSKFRDIITCDH